MSNREELIDAAEAAMDNVHDMDVTFRQYAEAATDAIFAAQAKEVKPSGKPNLVGTGVQKGLLRAAIKPAAALDTDALVRAAIDRAAEHAWRVGCPISTAISVRALADDPEAMTAIMRKAGWVL